MPPVLIESPAFRIAIIPMLKEQVMANSTRLNGVIKALEEGKTAFTTFSPADPESVSATKPCMRIF